MDFNQLFPDNREYGETLTRQCQLVMLRMLKILDYLCQKHQIEYFLYGGTLIGAIRHQGFIPWDDDLDVGMTRENYERFVQYAVPELPHDIFFQSDETDPNFPACHSIEAKLRDKYSRYNGKPKVWHNGLQVDISVYDKVYLPHNFFILIMNRLLILLFRRRGNKKKVEFLKLISRHSPVPLVYSSGFINGFKVMFRLGTNYFRPQEISSLVKAKFEDVDSWVPIGYDSYLKRRYGNYMQLPPAYKQKGHHSTNNILQYFSPDDPKEVLDIDKPDPFTPCNHKEVLQWKKRQVYTTS
ncbi:LicD family protein [Pontibacter mangrovi]|uniref:LicD family protein n=1 Tax=Pontibacter mangrovi TaxID=2589816 RepID=A0A501W2J7_9BACT|nr:LicD family protein [Pontibacter mangrovi]TPE42982.1 LicD family protein [Pontibacter mangrovi]